MRRTFAATVSLLALLAGVGCRREQGQRSAPPPAGPELLLRGAFTDGTPLSLEALRGRPWVVNVWLPG